MDLNYITILTDIANSFAKCATYDRKSSTCDIYLVFYEYIKKLFILDR